MIRFVVRTLLTAFAFSSILPKIGGISFSGTFADGLLYALLFALVAWGVGRVHGMVIVAITKNVRPAPWLITVPMMLVGFWFLPAVALLLLAYLAPHQLIVPSVADAFVAGIVLLFINVLTTTRIVIGTSRT